MTEKEQKGIDAKLRRIEQLFAERKRDDYESLRARLTEARELFHDMLAERFTEAFKREQWPGRSSAQHAVEHADKRVLNLRFASR